MKATRAELAARLREEQTRYDQLEKCWEQAKELAIKHAGDRDAAIRKIDEERAIYHARIEALHADLRVRTEERDAALRDARKHAETRQLADDLAAEVASLKIERGQIIETARQWKSEAMDAMLSVGYARAHAQILARLIVENKQGAHELAGIILAKTKKPCAP